jgi:hypothetical protein
MKKLRIEMMIAGAQKAGTTSLLNYLSEHPDILTHQQKEFTCFLDKEENDQPFSKIVAKYFDYGGSKDTRHLVAKSAGLYASEAAIKRLYLHNKNCRLVFIMRNPVDRSYSSFNMEKNRGWEYPDFSVVKDAVNIRTGKLINVYKILIDLGIYSKHLKNIYKYFPKEQVKLILFEKFIANPAETCRELFKWLGVDEKFVPDTHMVYNKTFDYRSKTLSKTLALLRRQDNPLKTITKTLLPSALYSKLSGRMDAINNAGKEFGPMEQEIMQYLRELYLPYNIELQHLTGLDLSGWD